MRLTGIGQPFGAVLAVFANVLPASGGVSADTLEVRDNAGGLVVALPFGPQDEICLRWQHSVTGGDVADCFVNRDGALVLGRSYLHDFAAGLGEVLGRGQLESAPGGGYWITGIDEAIPGGALALRVGPSRVDHRLTGDAGTVSLSQRAANQRVEITISATNAPHETGK